MKILIVTNMWPTPEHPYYGIFVKEQLEGINKYNPEIDIKVWFINGLKYKFNYFLSIFQINWHLIFNKYDIIHIHFGLSGIFLLFSCRKSAKVILTLHGSDINIESSSKLKVWITKKVIKRVDHIICVSEKMIPKINKVKDYTVLPCAVNTDLFVPLRKKDTSKIQIVFPSSKKRSEKNYPLFKSTLSILKKNYNIDVQEVLIENMSREKVVATLQESDILLLTSISEGSPQIVKEAMCCNTPVVSTNVGDVENLLMDVTNCFVINSFSPNDFLVLILKIIHKDRNLISNGRERIMKLNLDTKSTTHKLMDIYNNLKI